MGPDVHELRPDKNKLRTADEHNIRPEVHKLKPNEDELRQDKHELASN